MPVPPKPAEARPAATQPPVAPAGGSQEVEVEFWRSIKDSEDAEDFEVGEVYKRSETLANWRCPDGSQPALGDLTLLEEGVRCFPADAGLASDVAVVEAQAGQFRAANQIIDYGVANAADEAGRARLVRLQILLTRLGRPVAPAIKPE